MKTKCTHLFVPLVLVTKFSVAMMPSKVMQSGTIDPRLTNPTQNTYDVIPTKKIELPANTGWNISWEHCIGQSGNYLTLIKKNDKIGLAIFRPYRLEEKEKTLLLDDEFFSKKLNHPATILPVTPVIVNHGQYAIIWVKHNHQEKPVRINLNPSDITFSFVSNPSNLNSFTKNLAGNFEHPHLIGTTYTEHDGHLFYTLNAKTNTIHLIAPKDSRKWRFVDGMQVTPDGKKACAVVRENPTSDQTSLGMIFNNNQTWIQDSQLIKKYTHDKSLIKDFQIDNSLNLLDDVSINGKIDYYYLATQHTPSINFKMNGNNHPIDSPVIFEKDSPIFTTTITDSGVHLILFKIDGESVTPNVRNIISFQGINPNLLKDADFEISPFKKYSDRHFIFNLKIIPDASQFDSLSEQEKIEAYKEFEPNYYINVDTLNQAPTVVDPEKFKLFFVSANDKPKLQKALDDTLVFTNPKDPTPTLYFHRLPSIGETAFNLKKTDTIYKTSSEFNPNQFVKSFFNAIGIKGPVTIGNYCVINKVPAIHDSTKFVEKKSNMGYFITPFQQKMFSLFSSPSEKLNDGIYSVENSSENLLTSAGAAYQPQINFTYPIIMTTSNGVVCPVSNQYGIAHHTTDLGECVVGTAFKLTYPQLKLHPAIWTFYQPETNQTLPFKENIETHYEGEYNCVDRTGTWTAGYYKLSDGDHAIVKNIITDDPVIDLGKGTIYEMTWDGSVLCGSKIKDGKTYACIWQRTQENTWIEQIIEELEGLEPYQARIDHQTGKYITFESNGNFYFWSDKLGVIPFEQLLQQQCCYYTFSATSEISRSTTTPKVEALGRCDGKDILFRSVDGNSYTILLKDLSMITSEDENLDNLTNNLQTQLQIQ